MKFSPLAIAAVTAMSSSCIVLATAPKSQKSAKKVGNSFYGVAVPVDADDAEDTAFLSAESCNFPTGTFMYRGCGGSNYAVVFECQGEYCTYMERRLVRSTANNGTASVGFPDDEVLSCTLAGTFVFPAMADTTNEENGSSSCRVGYRTGISLDEGTCNSNQEYKIKIDVGGDTGNPNLMIHFSKDGGKTYYTEEEPRMAEPLGDMMTFRDKGTGLQRRLDWADIYMPAWNSISDTINKAMQNNSIPALKFASFAEKVLALDQRQINYLMNRFLCMNDSEFLRMVTAIGCDCFISYDAILPMEFLDDVLENLLGRPTPALHTFLKNPPPQGIECVSWIKKGCLKIPASLW